MIYIFVVVVLPGNGGVDEYKEPFEAFGEQLLACCIISCTAPLNWRFKSPLELMPVAEDDIGDEELDDEPATCGCCKLLITANFWGLCAADDEHVAPPPLTNVLRYEFSAWRLSFNSFILRYSNLSAADSICFSSANCFNVNNLSSNFACLLISKSYRWLRRSISFCNSLIFDCDSYLLSKNQTIIDIIDN